MKVISYLFGLIKRLCCRHRNGARLIRVNQGWKTARYSCYDCGREFNRKCTVVHDDGGYDDEAQLCESCGHWYDSSRGPCPECYEATLHKRLAESICYGKCGDPACEEAINHALPR